LSEQITEKGIVTSKKENLLEIIIAESENCNDCSAKLFCKPASGNNKSVFVKDTIGCRVGDTVVFSISGKNLLKASFKFYGLPLFLILAVIFFVNYILKDDSGRELYSVIFSIAAGVIYFIILFYLLKRSHSPAENIPVTIQKL